jgi:predicted small lipoprotein YifL
MTRSAMMMAVIALLGLAACGADGEPESPTRAEMPTTGLSVTGNVSVGISGTF